MDEIKSVKSLPFSGRKGEFSVWKFKFLACCAYQKCDQILLDKNLKAPKFEEPLDETIPKDKVLGETKCKAIYAIKFMYFSI
jgi:hypothetical protein